MWLGPPYKRCWSPVSFALHKTYHLIFNFDLTFQEFWHGLTRYIDRHAPLCQECYINRFSRVRLFFYSREHSLLSLKWIFLQWCALVFLSIATSCEFWHTRKTLKEMRWGKKWSNTEKMLLLVLLLNSKRKKFTCAESNREREREKLARMQYVR